MAQSSRPGGRRPDQSSGGRKPRVAGLRQRAQAGSSAQESRSEVTEESAGEESAEDSAAAGSAAEESTSVHSGSSRESADSGSAEESQQDADTAEPAVAESSAEEPGAGESAAGTSEGSSEPSGSDEPDSRSGSSETGTSSEPDTEASDGTPSAKTGSRTPGAKTPDPTSARPTGRGKRKSTRIGAARSESTASELPRAKPVQGTATAVADREDAEAGEAGATSTGDGADGGGLLHDRRVWFLGSLGLSAVFALLAGLFGANALGLLGGSQSNEALVDQAATSEVNGQVGDAVNRVFSYDFANTRKTEDAAGQVLTGKAIKQYNDLFATVKQQAPAQKLVVTTTVKSSGVTRLQGDHAQVLLFVDQNATRTTTGENNVGPAQISVDAVKDGDQWKIDSITQR